MKKADFQDDGRIIAPMNVEGLPWYTSGKKNSLSEKPDEMTPAQKAAFTWGVLKAAFLVVGVFSGVYFLFILFCTEVWFK